MKKGKSVVRLDIEGADIPDPDQFKDVGISTKLQLRCDFMINELEIDGKLAAVSIEDRPGGGGKTYVLVFEGGGTCEFDIHGEGKWLELMDSHGLDFSWAGNGTVRIRPYRPSLAPGSRSTWGREEVLEDNGSDEN
ncbi:hypothetical protein [Bradyrhizobium sp. Bra64]|uniref:hypothetical protein n=1 Tax=Bradyrhizobium sp. Bra64 TaxID=2926009 RepID=UPI002118CEB6|nr:hypothetical protein [Bradyrhizobium sp. Bra64]